MVIFMKSNGFREHPISETLIHSSFVDSVHTVKVVLQQNHYNTGLTIENRGRIPTKMGGLGPNS